MPVKASLMNAWEHFRLNSAEATKKEHVNHWQATQSEQKRLLWGNASRYGRYSTEFEKANSSTVIKTGRKTI